ncbi:hypothetical protein LUZ60_007004 [Juncus effusus]|nr:hypothetical protein LUZ60_007004 [Juncus effusus]
MTSRQLASRLLLHRHKTTSAQYVAERHRDATFEKLMETYKPYLKALPLIDLILSSPEHTLPLHFLSPSLSQRFHFNRGPLHFIRSFPRVFYISHCKPTVVGLTEEAESLLSAEAEAGKEDSESATCRIEKLVAMSLTRSLPLRAIFRVWRELGLPDDFEQSVMHRNVHVFTLVDNPSEPNTHIIKLVDGSEKIFVSSIESWRKSQQKDSNFEFKLQFPPCMKLKKKYRAKIKAWQELPYTSPYDLNTATSTGTSKVSKFSRAKMEKRAVGIMHEILSLTVEKKVEVEKISHFRKWCGIELNIRDLFLDHPGIFYLSTKAYRHTVFLREAYDKGRLIEPNPIYETRRKMVDLMLLRRHEIGDESE